MAPLRYRIGGRVEPMSGPRSDRLGEFGERSGDPRSGRGVDGEFVVAASEVLHDAWPAMITCADLSVRSPRIGLNRCFNWL
jgi:hypothetical protein